MKFGIARKYLYNSDMRYSYLSIFIVKPFLTNNFTIFFKLATF